MQYFIKIFNLFKKNFNLVFVKKFFKSGKLRGKKIEMIAYTIQITPKPISCNEKKLLEYKVGINDFTVPNMTVGSELKFLVLGIHDFKVPRIFKVEI